MRFIGIPLILALLGAQPLSSQSRHYELESVSAPSAEPLPFWLTANQQGRYSDQLVSSLRLGLFQGFSKDNPYVFGFDVGFEGTAALERNQFHFFPNQAFGRLRWQHFFLELGYKNPEQEWMGLSLTNNNFLRTNNSRAWPRISLSTGAYRPVPFVGEYFQVKLEYSESVLDDSRFVDFAMLHQVHASGRLTWKGFHFAGGIEHFAQWAGEGQPRSFSDYLKVITVRSGGDNADPSEQANALGNHLGRYFAQMGYGNEVLDVELHFDHFFEDGSGARFENLPDGVYGLFVHQKTEFQFLKAFVYQWIHTKDQSGPVHNPPAEDGRDNYFNNGIYRSGWTYHGRVIGLPLFDVAPTNSEGLVQGVVNNRVVAHHLAFLGEFSDRLDYKFSMTFSENKGLYGNGGFDRDQWSLGLGLYPTKLDLPFDIWTELALDLGENRPDGFGALMGISKQGLF